MLEGHGWLIGDPGGVGPNRSASQASSQLTHLLEQRDARTRREAGQAQRHTRRRARGRSTSPQTRPAQTDAPLVSVQDDGELRARMCAWFDGRFFDLQGYVEFIKAERPDWTPAQVNAFYSALGPSWHAEASTAQRAGIEAARAGVMVA